MEWRAQLNSQISHMLNRPLAVYQLSSVIVSTCITCIRFTSIHHSSMSFTADSGEEEEEIVKLSAAEVHKYEAEFSQLVVQFFNLQLKECIGKGTYISTVLQ